ncbi:MAG: phosphoribosylformylglycinamidine synthase I [Candidatus Bathyarchaeota archaeon]|nr:phosphoribosylformylglycinamidine synthase I [Candidatus Bathyarchaeota archaeon]
MKVRTLILRVPGTNCDQETVEAFEEAGSHVDLKHINSLIRDSTRLDDYHIFCIPGGFSYGDDLGAGKILACQLKYRLRRPIERFISEGKIILGICNGFQALVKAGLLPGLNGAFNRQEATLALNEGGLFVDRWVYVRCEETRCKPLNSLAKTIFYMPVNHAEGRFIAPPSILDVLEDDGYIVFRYVDPYGSISREWNPNGSMNNIAGICNMDGNIVGLMPHPEKHIHQYTHPSWTRLDRMSNVNCLRLFKALVDYAYTHLA